MHSINVKSTDQREQIKTYYGEVLMSSKDLQSSVCCTGEIMPKHLRQTLKQIDPEVKEKFYGCGSPIPDAIEGKTVLDLGCGSGRDVYLLSSLVGPHGRVIGVDMTEAQIAVAKKHILSQTKAFGYEEPNVDFRLGYIEDLQSIGIEDSSVDVVISNCVINLSPLKEAVFSEIFRVLKPGGEFLFSDIFSECRVPDHLKNDPVLHGECLSGAMYIEDFRRLLRDVGCLDYRVVNKNRVNLSNPDLEKKIGGITFHSYTIKAFKLHKLEDICEDYGQVAVYLGSIENKPHQYLLDDHHLFIKDKPMLVCGNTASILEDTRLSPHFRVTGNRELHFGPFNCRPSVQSEDSGSGGACC